LRKLRPVSYLRSIILKVRFSEVADYSLLTPIHPVNPLYAEMPIQ